MTITPGFLRAAILATSPRATGGIARTCRGSARALVASVGPTNMKAGSAPFGMVPEARSDALEALVEDLHARQDDAHDRERIARPRERDAVRPAQAARAQPIEDEALARLDRRRLALVIVHRRE